MKKVLFLCIVVVMSLFIYSCSEKTTKATTPNQDSINVTDTTIVDTTMIDLTK